MDSLGNAMTISDLKLIAALLVMVGIALNFFSLRNEPHTPLLESSPEPSLLLKWGGWAVTSMSAIAYIVLDYLQQ